jgi:hypothetical protein
MTVDRRIHAKEITPEWNRFMRKYTEAFDKKHGTKIWDRVREEATK